MRDPDEDPDIDRAYRAAVDLMADDGDPARLQQRRRAVLQAVHAAGAQAAPGLGPGAGTASTAPQGGRRPASNQPYWRRSTAWWSGAAAACVMAGSALLVVRMQGEPGADVADVADVAVRMADAGRQPAAPQGVAVAPVPASRPRPEAGPAPAAGPAAPLPRGAGTARSSFPGNESQGAAVMPDARPARPLGELARASPETSLAANQGAARSESAAPPLAKDRAEAAELPRPALAARPQAAPLTSPPAAEDGRANTGSSLNAATAPPRSDLLVAVSAGQVDAVRRILGSTGPDSDKDVDGRTALTLAVRRSDAALVTLLLDHGADRLAEDRFGQTPIGYAIAARNPAVVNAFGLK